MFAVIFELEPKPERKNQYLRLAEDLKPLLENIDGFISIERFQSLSQPEKLLSLSFWRDEEGAKVWRNQVEHRMAQQCGRADVFSDYRLRVAAVVRDYGMTDRAQAPEDSRAVHLD
ncbi:antibiotic biosynthesis monooxygenase [Hahella sp. KA22]|uniref:antibiotic biosynthesis monooxygenase family protein n=1 Tax=Hahella sp. KA22 TaxID=1628392 RepID=UPI000FDCF00B|nr:antibiotic biosynthesis monooxygenase [Hahella sp. KA22]AZZ94083.1 antibiotic biosynthesis monooxygenase [Hahella sp. KA22]QAY57457.1 antibiotic biosynthesis monooxygenase [Hahella sp. KA22]